MYLKNGVLVKGSPPKNQVIKANQGPKVVKYHSQRTAVIPSGSRLDALLNGQARICIYRSLGGLGDIMMATPISRGIKRKYPLSHLTYAVPASYAGGDLVALLENNPYIDEVIDYQLINRDDYDSFTDITRTGLSLERPYSIPPNRIDLFAQAAGVPLNGCHRPIYYMTEEEQKWGKDFVKNVLRKKKYKGVISIHLGSRDPKRTWPQYRVREFINEAHQKGYFCFLFEWGASEDDWKLAGCHPVFNFQIRQAAAILNATDILVCPDSMMLHLAGALDIKTVGLFGSMPPACRINYYPNAIAVINQQISCLGCVYASCSNNYYCMSSLFPESVLNAVTQKLKDPKVEDTEFSEADIVVTNHQKRINTLLL